MYQLKNVDHHFQVAEGHLGMTVRQGTKWADRAADRSTVTLWNCPAPHQGACLFSTCQWEGEALLVGSVVVNSLAEIPSELLRLEHDWLARDREHLTVTLEQVYGTTDGPWTLLLYLRTFVVA